MRTEHEPHSPSPHPSLVPVRCRSSRSTSSSRFIGAHLHAALLTVHNECDRSAAIALIAPPPLQQPACAASLCKQILRQQRNRAEANARRIANRIQNRRRRPIVRQFADALRAISAVAERNFFKVHVNRRHIFGRRHNVVGHLVVGHVPVLQDHFFVERVANALRDAAFNLPAGQHRIETRAHFLHRPELFHFSRVGHRVHRHLRHLNRPRIRGIRLAAIFLIVPENARRRLVAAQRNNFALRCAIAARTPQKTLRA